MKQKIKKVVVSVFLFALILYSSNIIFPGNSIVKASKVTEEDKDNQVPVLATKNLKLSVGETAFIQINNLLEGAVVDYSSFDSSVISVSKDGELKALKDGETKIIVHINQADNGYELTLFAIVDTDKTRIKVSPSELTLGKGETYKVNYSLEPQGVTDKVLFSSDDNLVASVDEFGNISANEIGTANITLTLDNGNSVACKVTVKNAPTGIKLALTTKTLKQNDTYNMKAKISSGYSRSGLTYHSSNESIAKVNEEGKITALKTGTAKVVVSTYNGKKVILTLRVVKELATPKALYLSNNHIILAKGQSRSLYYQVSPWSLADHVKNQMTWSSSNTSIATVDKNGRVTANKDGKAKITLSTKDGSIKNLVILVTVTKRKSGTSYTENGLSIVSTSKSKYTYSQMVGDLKALEKKYGDCIKVSVLENTYDNRNIYQLILGNPNAKKKVLIQSSIHAREYMTTMLNMKQIEFYCKNYYSGRYSSQYFSELFDDVAFYIVPMVNPDGVSISQFGPKAIRNKTLRSRIIAMCKRHGRGSNSYYRTWKANARGVDLNRNFDVYWGILVGDAPSASAYGYKGPSAASEIETRVLVNLFNRINPTATISYHATGSIIYWDYGQKGAFRSESYRLTSMAKALTSYRLVRGFSKYHATGFSDWVSIHQQTPAITIEIGTGSCPLNQWEFQSIWGKNKMMFLAAAKLYQ